MSLLSRLSSWDALLKRERPEPEWHYRTVQGYLDRGKIPNLLGEGWEIFDTQPVIVAGVSFGRQQIVNLRRRNPAFQGDGVV